MEEATLSKLEGYPALNVRKALHKSYEDIHPIKEPMFIAEPQALVGIEVEVEGMRAGPTYMDYYWNTKEDHSLRNYGWEFTSIPLRGYQIEYALDYLHAEMVKHPLNKPDYSPRTSIHVHLNVRDMTWSQLKSFVLLYTIFERHFFHIAGTKRESSIFCVPIYRSIQRRSISTLEGVPQNWSKYNALNLGTITGNGVVDKYGTVEFRHLYGTGDKSVIINWINNIFKLRRAAANYPFPELLERVKHMNTTSDYVALYVDVFGEFADTKKMVKYDFEDGVTHAKMWEWGCKVNSDITLNQNSRYYQTIHKPKKETALADLLEKKMVIPKGVNMAGHLTGGIFPPKPPWDTAGWYLDKPAPMIPQVEPNLDWLDDEPDHEENF